MARKLRHLVALMAMSLIASGCVFVELVSVDVSGNQLPADSVVLDVAGDGRWVLFKTKAAAQATDTNNDWDVYRRDTRNGTLIRASVTSGGGSGDGSVDDASISDDGRWVAYDSDSTNIVPGDTNGVSDVFLRDIDSATVTRISENSIGVEGNGPSLRPDISADGDVVGFESSATNLVVLDTNGVFDVFAYEHSTGILSLVSRDSSGTLGNARSDMASVSGDGSIVAFRSYATNLVAGDTNGVADIFVKSSAGPIERASVSSGGAQANGESSFPSLASAGNAVAFQTRATNLFGVDADGTVNNVVVRDYTLGATWLASFDETGTQVAGVFASLNSGGYIVSWTGPANNLHVSDVTNGDSQIASTDADGTPIDGRFGVMDDGGDYVAFDTPDVLPGDTNGFEDVYVVAFREPEITTLVPSDFVIGSSTPVTITGSGFQPGLSLPDLGGVLTFTGVSVNAAGTQITATMHVAPGAAEQLRTLWVQNPDGGPGTDSGSLGSCHQCVKLVS